MSAEVSYLLTMAAVEAIGAICFSIRKDDWFALGCVVVCGVCLYQGLRAL